MRESEIEEYLVNRVKALGGEVRKVKWDGRRSAPDRVVMMPFTHYYQGPNTVWVEVKNPETIKTFPADFREKAQAREHARMRKAGQVVLVLGTFEQVDQHFPLRPVTGLYS